MHDQNMGSNLKSGGSQEDHEGRNIRTSHKATCCSRGVATSGGVCCLRCLGLGIVSC